MDNITLLPIGCVEEHGYLPVDTDTIIAQAFCCLVSKQIGATVTEPITEGYCPTTFLLDGTEEHGFLDVFNIISKRVTALMEKGHRHIILVNIHKGNDSVIKSVIQETYIRNGTPLFYFNPYEAFSRQLNDRYFSGKDNNHKECSLLQAGREILSMALITGPAEDEYTSRDELVEKLKEAGTIGFAYRESSQHIAWRNDADIQSGRQFLEETARMFLPLVTDFKRYIDVELAQKK